MGKIIWIASYPKSGNTWMRGFLHNLLNADDKPLSINSLDEFIKGESAAKLYRQFTDAKPNRMDPRILASLRPKVHQSLTSDGPQNVFVKTHTFLGHSFGAPTITPEVTAGAIYIVRNPLDICISLASHIDKTIDEAIDFMGKETAGKASPDKVMEFWHSWSTNVSSWTKVPQPEIKVIRYEDLLENSTGTFSEAVKFLNLDVTESRIQKAIQFASFDAMRNQEEKEYFKERPPHSPRFFRKGIYGEWREKLTKDQIDRLVEDHYEQMDLFGYLPD
jgi:hypothetical protein